MVMTFSFLMSMRRRAVASEYCAERVLKNVKAFWPDGLIEHGGKIKKIYYVYE